MPAPDLHVVVPNRLDPRLGRVVVHDPRSKAFAFPAEVDKSSWHSVSLRIYDPTPNPNQVLGDCTGCEKAMAFNTVGSRKAGRVLTLKDADRIYSLATELDPWPEHWPPDDSGSSGLAAAKAAQQLGYGGEYRWVLNGADGVVQALMSGASVGIGSYWYEGGFHPKPEPGGGVRIEMTGRKVGGHEWHVHRYDAKRDLIGGRCWWGSMRDFWIRRAHLQALLDEDGDAIVQQGV